MKVFVLFILFIITAQAQYIDTFEGIEFEYTDNVINSFSAGNLGFDGKINTYNPRLMNRWAGFFVQAGIVNNISQSIKESGRGEYTQQAKVYPDLRVQYQDDWFGLQFTYITRVASNVKTNMHVGFNFQPTVETNQLSIPAAQTSMQLSGIFYLAPKLFINVGVITNSFETKFDIGGEGYVKYSNNFFNNFQLAAGINYAFSNYSRVYAVYKSAYSQNELDIDYSLRSNSRPSLDHPENYYPGLIGVGAQTDIGMFSVSIEAAADYFTFMSTSQYRQSRRDLAPPFLYSLEEWTVYNTRFIGGVTYRPASSLELGVLFSTYMGYRNPFYGYGERVYEASPYALNVSGSYIYDFYFFNIFYQYSGVHFSRGGFYPDQEESSHYLGLSAGVYF